MADDALLNSMFNGQQPYPLSYADSVVVELAAHREYAIFEPLKINAGTHGKNFRLIVRGNGARILYCGGKGHGPAFRVGRNADDVTNDKGAEAIFCTFEDVEFAAGDYGADELLYLENVSFSSFRDCQIRGPGNRSVGVGVRMENCKSVRLDQFSIGYCDIGLKSGEVNNVFSWTGGKVHHANVGIYHDGSVFDINTVDCSWCSEYAAVLSKASKGRLHLYTERSGATAVVKLQDCRCVTVAGLLNCKNGYTDVRIPVGAEVYDSEKITFENCECLMPLSGQMVANHSSTVTIAPSSWLRMEVLP